MQKKSPQLPLLDLLGERPGVRPLAHVNFGTGAKGFRLSGCGLDSNYKINSILSVTVFSPLYALPLPTSIRVIQPTPYPAKSLDLQRLPISVV